MPLLSVASWHFVSKSYPLYDSADYFLFAQRLVKALEEQGTGEFLHVLYRNRGERPVIFGMLAVPSLILTGGSVVTSIAFTMLAILLLLETYLYLLFRLWLAPAYAAFGVLFICTMPSIFHGALVFQPELLFLACFTAAAFHTARSNFFARPVHNFAAGAFFGFALCSRPVEATLIAAVPVLAYLVYGIKAGKQTWRDLALLVFVTALVALAIFLTGHYGVDFKKILAGVAAILLAIILSAPRIKLSVGFARVLVLCAAIFFFWIAPHCELLLRWALSSAFFAVDMTGLTYRFKFWTYLLKSIDSIGGFHLCFLLLGFFWVALYRRRLPSFTIPVGWILASLCPLLTAVLATDAALARYLMGATLILFFGMLVNWLAMPQLSGWGKVSLLAIPVVMSGIYVAGNITNHYLLPRKYLESKLGWAGHTDFFHPPPLHRYEVGLRIFDALLAHLPKNRPLDVATIRTGRGTASVYMEYGVFNVIAHERRVPVRFHNVVDFDWNMSAEQRYRQLQGLKLDFLLIGDIRQNDDYWGIVPYIKNVVKECLAGRCEKQGFKLIDRISVESEFGETSELLLLRLNPS